MASSSPLECGVCNEKFDEEERCPRILPCYHHICSHCIGLLIINNLKSCPFCRKEFEAETAKDIRINTGVVDLLTFIAQQDAAWQPNEEGVELAYAAERTSSLLLRKCRDAEKLVDESYQCTASLVKSLTDQNELISSTIMNYFERVLSYNKENIAELKMMEERIMDFKRLIKEKEEDIRILKENLRTPDEKYTEDESVIKEAEENNDNVGVWITSMREILDEDTELRTKVTEDLDTATSITENVVMAMTTSKSDSKAIISPNAPELQAHQPSAPPLYRMLSQQFSDMNLSYGGRSSPYFTGPSYQSISANTGTVSPILERPFSTEWLKSMTILGIQKIGRIKRHAKLSLNYNKLHVHTLRDGPYHPNAYTLKHEDILRMDPTASTVFLDISVRSKNYGRVYIDLRPLTEGARNFALLCTGEMGPTYAGSHFLRIHHRGTDREVIQGGDYEHKGGRGGRTLVSGLNLSSTVYKRKWTTGLVRGVSYQLFSQFYINTRHCPDIMCQGVIGRVISGLDVLLSAIDATDDVSSIYIQDCGIVLELIRRHPIKPLT